VIIGPALLRSSVFYGGERHDVRRPGSIQIATNSSMCLGGSRMTASPEIISRPERVVLGLFAPIALAIGGIAGGILAGKLDGKTLTSVYWDKLLTITGVSALPLVAVAVLVIRARLNERRTNPVAFWGGSILLGGLIAFMVVLVVIMICLYEMVTTPEAGKVAGGFSLWVATLGAGLSLGAVAASVAAAALDKIDDDPPAGPG
jgi:hypothetical protein